MTIFKYIKQLITRSYFLISLLLLAVLPLLLLLYLTYNISKSSLQTQVERNLVVMADSKATAIETYINKQKTNAQILARSPTIINTVVQLNKLENSPDYLKISMEKRDELSSYLLFLIDLLNINTFYLITDNDKVAFSISKKNNTKSLSNQNLIQGSELEKMVYQSKTLMETGISTFELVKGEAVPSAYIASPIFDKGTIVGVIVIQLDNEGVFNEIRSHTGFSNTIETIVGRYSNLADEPILLTMPLKFGSNGKLYMDNLRHVDTLKRLVEATKGTMGKGVFIDYRGQEVVGVWKYLPSLRWGMLIKVDTSDAFAPITNLRNNILLLVAVSILLLMGIAAFVSKKLRQSEAFLTNVINSIPSIIVSVDEKNRITRWNDPALAAASTGNLPEKGELITDVYPFLAPYVNLITEAIDQKKSQKVDRLVNQTPQGPQYLELVIYPLLGEEFKGSTLLISNITEKIKMQQTSQQQDKLASIGVLTAGIAHEINNPLNFIQGNIGSLRRDIDDIISVYEKYDALNPNDIKRGLEAIHSYKKEIDIETSISETHELLKGIKDGADRTVTIVKDLRTFSRLDESEMKKASVEDGIDSTLTLLINKYKNRIRIVKEYGRIPQIDCYPGKLNQVFMNILANAIQAIKGEGTIFIKTESVDSNVIISIKDTGSGIKKEHLAHIFEPFFTTKDVGEGTGLGLSISHSIIEDHHGSIEVKSEVGVGTEFVIILPKVQR